MPTIKYPKATRTTAKPAILPGDPLGSPLRFRIADLGRFLLFAQLLLSPLVFYRETLEVFEYNKVALLRCTAIALLGLGLAVWFSQRVSELWASLRPLFRDPIVWGVILFLLSAIFSTVTSISPRTSFWGAHESYAGLFTISAYAVLFFGTIHLCRTADDRRRLMLAPVLGAAAASAYALLQVAHLDPVAWQQVSDFRGYVRPFSTLGHPNFLAAYLVMALPFILYWAGRAFQYRRWWVCGSLGSVAIIAALSVGLSLSRGGWLALASVLLVLAVGWGWLAGKMRGVLYGSGVAIGFACLITLTVGLNEDAEVLSPLRQRWNQLADVGPRQYIWHAGLAILREHPFSGCGLDTFQLAFPAHRTVDYWRAEWNQTPTRAHNELIQILATQGLAGGIAVVVLLCGLGRAVFRAWRHGDLYRRGFLIAVAASLIGFCVQDFFSFTVAGIGTLFVTLAAMLVRMQFADTVAPRSELSSVSRARLAIVALRIGIGVGAVAMIFLGVVRPWQANCVCAQAEAVLDSDPHLAVALAEQALALDDTQDAYWVRLGSAAQIDAWRTSDATERQRGLSGARDAFENAVRMVPVNAYHHANVGRVLGDLALLGSASSAEAFAEFDAALALDRANAYFYADAGMAALRLGDIRRARAYAEPGLQAYPDFAPLLALLAYTKITEQSWRDADRLLLEAAYADWHGDADGQNRVAHALDAVRNRSSR
jgi:O-antigen ligase